jgi:hypothetical protein
LSTVEHEQISMDLQEIRELIPFYAAGTLTDAERSRVEEALKSSFALQEELAAWERIRDVVIAGASATVEGHLSPKQFVDRAMGMGTGAELLALDDHLRSCSECSNIMDLVMGSALTGQEEAGGREAHRRWTVTSLRRVSLIAITAAVLVVVALTIYKDRTERGAVPLPPETVSALIPDSARSTTEPMAVSLTYRPTVRSASHDMEYIEVVRGEERDIQFIVAVPRNAVHGIRYRVTISRDHSESTVVADSAQRFASGKSYDSLAVLVPHAAFPPAGTIAIITFREILPTALRDLTSEEYRFEVGVRER